MTADFMSSEESDDENDTIIVKPLPWRSSKVAGFMQNLDVVGIEGKTPQARRQRKEHVISSMLSTRPKPTTATPSWAYTS